MENRIGKPIHTDSDREEAGRVSVPAAVGVQGWRR